MNFFAAVWSEIVTAVNDALNVADGHPVALAIAVAGAVVAIVATIRRAR